MAIKVLIVTDYSGVMHITPMANKSFYQSRNVVVKDKKFTFREHFTEEEALKFVADNQGIDPNFVTPAKVQQTIASKDEEIALLKEKLAAMENSGNKAGEALVKDKAVEVITKIQAAQSINEVNEIVGDDTRKTVIDAANNRIAELTK